MNRSRREALSSLGRLVRRCAGLRRQPVELKVPADTKIKLIVKNEDATPEEFESTDFSRETVVLPNHTVVIYVGPLRAGSYGFFGDFHRETAQGRLIVQ